MRPMIGLICLSVIFLASCATMNTRWEEIHESSTPVAAYDAFLKQYPDPKYAAEAQNRIRGLLTFNHLLSAINDGQIKEVQAVLDRRPELIDSSGTSGLTPLHLSVLPGGMTGTIAVFGRYMEVAAFIIERAHNVNPKYSDGATPLHMLAREPRSNFGWLGPETRGSRVEIVWGSDPSRYAGLVSVQFLLLQRLLKKGPDVNAVDSGGNTPLHLAAANNYTDTVTSLLNKGANVNAVDSGGNTPLHLAVARAGRRVLVDRLRTVTSLLAAGANRDLRNAKGETALDIAKNSRSVDLIRILLGN